MVEGVSVWWLFPCSLFLRSTGWIICDWRPISFNWTTILNISLRPDLNEVPSFRWYLHRRCLYFVWKSCRQNEFLKSLSFLFELTLSPIHQSPHTPINHRLSLPIYLRRHPRYNLLDSFKTHSIKYPTAEMASTTKPAAKLWGGRFTGTVDPLWVLSSYRDATSARGGRMEIDQRLGFMSQRGQGGAPQCSALKYEPHNVSSPESTDTVLA